jgi:hypothetical protein
MQNILQVPADLIAETTWSSAELRQWAQAVTSVSRESYHDLWHSCQ